MAKLYDAVRTCLPGSVSLALTADDICQFIVGPIVYRLYIAGLPAGSAGRYRRQYHNDNVLPTT